MSCTVLQGLLLSVQPHHGDAVFYPSIVAGLGRVPIGEREQFAGVIPEEAPLLRFVVATGPVVSLRPREEERIQDILKVMMHKQLQV